MKAKYFFILAYKHETGYKALSHRQEMWLDNRAIHRRADQPSPKQTKNLQLKTGNQQTADLYKMAIYWIL